MQAIILAAGEGTRMRPLTRYVPKPMVRILDKNLIELVIGALPQEIDEVILVVGYLKEQIINHFGDTFEGRKITYVKQKKPRGTAHAIKLCEPLIRGRFMILMGDGAYSKEDLEQVLPHDRAMMIYKVRGKFAGGNIVYDKEGNLVDIVEGIHTTKGGVINTNVFVLGKEYFDYEMVSIKEGKEYGLPQTVLVMSKDYPVYIVEAKSWMQIEDLNDVKNLKRKLKKGN